MEKIKLEPRTVENMKIAFRETYQFNDRGVKELKDKGIEIEVYPFIPLTDQIILIVNYLNNYFQPEQNFISRSKCDYVGAEYALTMELVDKYTNIDIVGLGSDILYESNLWEKIKLCFSNYDQFRETLERIVNDVKQDLQNEKSLGNVLGEVTPMVKEFIQNGMDLVEKLASTEINDETLEKLKTTLKEITDGVSSNPIAKAAFSEADKAVKTEKK
jgi:hypothetical protein